jgi:hypothetical protein
MPKAAMKPSGKSVMYSSIRAALSRISGQKTAIVAP